MYQVGATISGEFPVKVSGMLGDPDALPVGTLAINNVDTATTVTVSKVAVGQYTWQFSAAGLSAGDEWRVRIEAYFDGERDFFIAKKGVLAPAWPATRAEATADKAAIIDAISDNSLLGSGDILTTLQFTKDGESGGTPVPDAQVRVSTDTAGAQVVAGPMATNDVGNVQFMLNANVQYYLFSSKSGQQAIIASPFYIDDQGAVTEDTL